MGKDRYGRRTQKGGRGAVSASCEMCMFYEYDEEYEEMVCTVSMDEDDMMRFYTKRECPYFRFGDEYTIVRKQN